MRRLIEHPWTFAGPRRLRTMLLGLVIAAIAPAILGLIIHLRSQHEAAVDHAFGQADLISAAARAQLTRHLVESRVILEHLAAGPAVKSLESRQCQVALAEAARLPTVFGSLSLSAADGRSICSERGLDQGLAAPPSDAWFSEVILRRAFTAGNYAEGSASSKWVVRLGVPVLGQDQAVVGVLAFTQSLNELNRLVIPKSDVDAFTGVIDGSSRVLLRSHLFKDRVGKPAVGNIALRVSVLRDGSPGPAAAPLRFRDVGVDGRDHFYSADLVPETDWVLVSGVSAQTALASYRASVPTTTGLILVSLGTALFLARWLSRLILLPLAGLVESMKLRTRDSHGAPAEVAGPLEFREAAQAFNAMAAFRDQIQMQLAASQEEYQSLLVELPIALLVQSPSGEVEMGNAAAVQLFEAELCEPVALTEALRRWHPLDDQGRRLPGDVLDNWMVAKELMPLRAAVVGMASTTPDGGDRVKWLLVNAYAQNTAAGAIRNTVMVAMDITLTREAQSLRVAKEAADNATRAKSLFLSRVSHELRTPLNAIVGFGHLLLARNDLAPAARTQLRHIAAAGQHLLGLVNRLLETNAVESNQTDVQITAVELGAVVKQAVDLCSTQAEASQVSIEFESQGDEHRWVHADRARLLDALTNLITNAIKYNRVGGLVLIRCQIAHSRSGEARTEVQVSDTGVGLSPDQLTRLFSPFDRLGRENSGIEGTGLGLSIARGSLRAMGGDIYAQSEDGVGSTFTIVLSNWEMSSQGTEDRLDATRWAKIADEVDKSSRLRVLYIEDNPVNLEIMSAALRELPYVEFAAADSGTDGLQKIESFTPELVLLDLNLPDMSGFEVACAAAGRSRQPELEIWAVTADASVETRARCVEHGLAQYFTKPVDLHALEEAIARFAVGVSAQRAIPTKR